MKRGQVVELQASARPSKQPPPDAVTEKLRTRVHALFIVAEMEDGGEGSIGLAQSALEFMESTLGVSIRELMEFARYQPI